MLDLIRNNRKAMLVLLVILVIPSFVIFGVNFNFGGGANDLAHVGKNKITNAQFEYRMQEIIRNNPTVDFNELNNPQVKMQVLGSMIQELLWSAAAKESRLLVSDQTVRIKIPTMPIFSDLLDEKGRLSKENYSLGVATRTGYKTGDYENLVVRPQVMVDRMKMPVSLGFTSLVDAKQYMQFADSRYIVKQQIFEAAQFADEMIVTDEEIQTRYDTSKQLFVEPAKLNIEYVLFDTTKLGNHLTMKELQDFYEKNKQLFVVKEERQINHILIEGDNAAQKAAELRSELRQDPARFAELAKANSADTLSASDGGALGYVTKDMLAPLGEAAFVLTNVGDISEPIKSSFGYHLILLTGKRGGEAAAFEEIFPLIETELRQRAAAPLSAKAVERFVTAVAEQNESFENVAAEFGLNIERAKDVIQNPVIPVDGVLGNTDFLSAVFDPKAISSMTNIRPVKVGPTQLISARVLNHQAEAIKPLEDVKEQLKLTLAQEKAIAYAGAEAQKIMEQWQTNSDLVNQADEVSFTQSEINQWIMGIQAQETDPNVMLMLQEVFTVAEKAFEYNPASTLPETFVLELPNRGFILAQLQRIEVPEDVDEALLAQYAAGLRETIVMSQGDAILRFMEKEFDAGAYPEALQKLNNL